MTKLQKKIKIVVPPAGASSCCTQPPLPSPAPMISSTLSPQLSRASQLCSQENTSSTNPPLARPHFSSFWSGADSRGCRASASRRGQRATAWFGSNKQAPAPARWIYTRCVIRTHIGICVHTLCTQRQRHTHDICHILTYITCSNKPSLSPTNFIYTSICRYRCIAKTTMHV